MVSIGSVCSFPECENQVKATGLCHSHYAQKISGQVLRKMHKRDRHDWSEWYISTTGYVVRSRWVGDGKGEKQYQHRYVMTEILGRDLLPGENVHHINGDRTDNRPENLELWSTRQPPGQRVSDKVKWAKEIIALYGEDF